jgi:hypothetical protein
MSVPLETLPVDTVASDSNCYNFPLNVLRFLNSIPKCAPWQMTGARNEQTLTSRFLTASLGLVNCYQTVGSTCPIRSDIVTLRAFPTEYVLFK